MKKRDSQQAVVEEYLSYKVEDPLKYVEFAYDRSEWDNIPYIISKFITFISKHLEALTSKCNERFSQISTEDLQMYTDSKLYQLEQKFDNLTRETFAIRNSLLDKITKIEKDTNNLVDQNNKLMNEQQEQ